jgi:hypothetical protein
MIVYLETSVLLRSLLKQQNPLPNWGRWDKAYTSDLTRVEAFRTFDRLRVQDKMNLEELANSVQDFDKVLKYVDEIRLNSLILRRASQAYPTVIGTLDALHLSSAILWQEHNQKEIVFLTHDDQLGRAALAIGMKSEGF